MQATVEEMSVLFDWLRSHLQHTHLYLACGLDGLDVNELRDLHRKLHGEAERTDG
jgi:hypothetical protein